MNLNRVGRHLLFGTTVDNVHLLSIATHGRAAAVHSRISTTYNGNGFATKVVLLSGHLHIPEEVDTRNHVVCIVTFTADERSFLRTNRQDGGIVLLLQVGIAEIITQLFAGVKVYAEVCNIFDFLIENIVGQAVFGNTISQPSSGIGCRLVDVGLVPFNLQEMRSRKPAGATTDNGYFFAC